MTKEDFLTIAGKRYNALQALNVKDFYEYEKVFDEIWTELGREVLEKNIGDVPNDRRKKNALKIWRNKHFEQSFIQ